MGNQFSNYKQKQILRVVTISMIIVVLAIILSMGSTAETKLGIWIGVVIVMATYVVLIVRKPRILGKMGELYGAADIQHADKLSIKGTVLNRDLAGNDRKGELMLTRERLMFTSTGNGRVIFDAPLQEVVVTNKMLPTSYFKVTWGGQDYHLVFANFIDIPSNSRRGLAAGEELAQEIARRQTALATESHR